MKRKAKTSAPKPPKLPPSDSQAMLSRRLTAHFANRITIDLSEQQIVRWKRGDGLPAGAELPPPKLGNQYDTAAWAQWVEKVLLPIHGRDRSAKAKSLYEQAAEAEARTKIHKEGIAKIQLEHEQREHDDRWILRASARATCFELMSRVLHFVETEYERQGPVQRRAYLNTGPTTEAFFEWDSEQEKARLDRIRNMCAVKAEEEKE